MPLNNTDMTALSPEERNRFLLRRLHSLTGIVPVGVFLIEHLLTNSRAFGWFGGGPEAFNKDVKWLHELPYLLILEIVFIFLPLAFHAGYGVKIALSAQHNVGAYRYVANWRYTLQRITGFIALAFIVVHLFKFRFAHWVDWGPEFIGNSDPFAVTAAGLNAWRPFGVAVPPAFTFGMYIVGLWATVFHFCNGIWTFCITWGITVGERAQRRVGLAAVGLAVVLLAWGHASLAAFRDAGKQPRSNMTDDAIHVAGAEASDEADGP